MPHKDFDESGPVLSSFRRLSNINPIDEVERRPRTPQRPRTHLGDEDWSGGGEPPITGRRYSGQSASLAEGSQINFYRL